VWRRSKDVKELPILDTVIMTPSVRGYSEGDQKNIVEFLKSVFAGWPRIDASCSPLDYWRWKYEGRPGVEKIISVVEAEGGEIVGCLHTIPLEYKGLNGVDRCVIGVDFAVHPDYRGSGLGLLLSNHINEVLSGSGYKFSYSITGNPKLIKSMSRDQLLFPRGVLNYVKINDIDRQLKAYPMSNDWLVRAGFPLLKRVIGLKGLFRGVGGEQIVERDDSFGVEADSLWGEVEDNYRFAIRRTAEYLNWKYCDPRVGGYEIRKTYDGDRLAGYCVFRANRFRPDYPVGYISELVTVPGRLDAADALVKAAVEWFDDADVNIVNFQNIEASPMFRVLEGHGFLNSQVKINVFINPFGKHEELEAIIGGDPRRIMVSWGDHDVLPVDFPRYM
jgi:GNAT superfamily N-acetyltransferase